MSARLVMLTGSNLSAKKEDQKIIKDKSYNKNIFNISESEIKQHREFLKRELKKNFY